MNENKKKSSDWRIIIGGIVLIVVLFVAIKFIFWGLGETIRRNHPEVYQNQAVSQSTSASQSGQEAPGFCVHCGKELPESFQWGQFCPWCGEKIEQ